MLLVGLVGDADNVEALQALGMRSFTSKTPAMTHFFYAALREHPGAKSDTAIRACAQKGDVISIADLERLPGLNWLRVSVK